MRLTPFEIDLFTQPSLNWSQALCKSIYVKSIPLLEVTVTSTLL